MKTSDSGLNVNRSIYPDAVACDTMRLRAVSMGGRGVASRPPIISNLQESWSKVSQASKRVGHSIFCDVFFSNNLVTIVGQLAERPPPQQKVSRHKSGQLDASCHM